MKGEKPEVTILILTCHRPFGLKRILDSIKLNTKDIGYDLLVMIDRGDIDAYNYCIKRKIKCFLTNSWNDFVKQMNVAVYSCDTPYFVTLGDDLEIISNDWLSRSLKTFKEKFPNDFGLLTFERRMFIAGMSSKKFVHKMGGHLFFPSYKHYSSDRELTNIADGLGCLHRIKNIVAHHHYSETGIKDDTYSKSEKYYARDRRLRRKRFDDGNLLKIRNYYNFKD